MSFDLSQLRFTVETKQLDDAITRVGVLATAIDKLKKPLKELPPITSVVPDSEPKAVKKNLDMMGQAVDQFYKRKDKLAKEDIASQERATASQERQAKTQQDILQRQVAILDGMNEGWSKGQASVLAAGKAAGLTNDEMSKLQTTVATIRKLQGQDPFDQSTSGLVSLTKELGQAREGYRQLIDYTKRYEAAKSLGDGSESSIMAMSKKETDNLYRDKLRAFELFKQQRVILKEDVAARISASEITIEVGNKELKAQKEQFREGLRATENHYKNIANIKRPLEDIRAVEGTKKRDKLNYLARATSVQLGDIGVSLAGGQNPLTVLLQQGDQMRAIFGDIGREGHNMQTVLNSAFTQIVTGFRDVALNLGEVVLVAIKKTAIAFAEVAMSMTGMKAAINEAGLILDTFAYKMGLSSKASEALAANFKATANALITPLIAAGVIGLVAMLVTLGIAYKNILATSHELSNALILNGAALAVTKKEAMSMSSAMASGAATSLDVAKILTEIAQAGNLGKESIVGITTAAIDMNRYLGVSTQDIVKEYSKLAADPVKTLTEIGMATGRITARTIDNIRELEEQGKHIEAVALATKELDRIYGEMAQSGKDNMTPLGKLWDEIKQGVNRATEAVYEFAQSEGVIAGLTVAWRGFATLISGIAYTIKGMVIAGAGVIAQRNVGFDKSASDKIKTDTDAALKKNSEASAASYDAIWNPEVARAQAAATATKIATEAHAKYITVVEAGIATTRLETKAEIEARKANREGIAAATKIEKLKDEFGANSRLDPARRAKAIADKKSQTDIEFALVEKDLKRTADATVEGQKKLQEDLAKLQKDKEGVYFGIEKKFKDEKPKGEAGAIRDTLSAQQQQIENDRNEAVRNAKMAMDAINSEHKRGLVNDYDYSTQKASIEQKSLADSIKFYTAEIEIAKKKVNSKKEVETLEGKIKKAESDIKDKELEKGYAQLEFIQKLRDATIAEIQTLTDKTKAQKLENELIGLSVEQVGKLKAERVNSAIAMQAENVAYLKRNGYAEESSLMYNLEVQKLKALTDARDADTEALNKNTEAELKKLNKSYTDEAIKNYFSTTDADAELEFRKKSLGLYGEEKEAAKRRYEEEKALLQINRKELEDLVKVREEYNSKLTGNPQADARVKEDLSYQEDQIRAFAKKQTATVREGVKQTERELADAKLENFSKGVADALVTGMTDGAKAGKKKLRDLIVAELTKTITLNIQANIQALLSGMMGGKSSGGGFMDMLFGGGGSNLSSLAGGLMQMMTGGSVGASAMSLTGANTVGALGGDSLGALIGLNGGWSGVAAPAVEGLTALAPAVEGLTVAALPAAPAVGGMGTAIMGALGPVGLFAAGALALFAIFGDNEERIPTVLNDLALFNDSLVGLPLQEIAVGSDAAAQGLRDVLYGLENATPAMRKLAGETIQLTGDLMRAKGDVQGAKAYDRNIASRGLSKEELAMYDLNQGLKDQIQAARDGAAAASAGASAAQAAAQAEEQLAQTRYNIAGKLNVLLGRTTQKEFDRATALAGTTDAASISMLKLTHQLEDMHAAVDASYAKLERSIAAERKLIDLRLQSAKELAAALKTALDAVIQPMARNAAQAQLRMYTAVAKAGGSLPTAEALKPALETLAQPSIDLFGSFSEYMIDQARTANDISDLADYADKQVDAEQLSLERLDAQLALAKSQLDALKGVDNSVVSVEEAILSFQNSMVSLASAQASAGSYSYSPMTGTSSGGSGGGGGYSGGGSSAPAGFANIAGQDNKDIVAAYREYYNRNPDDSGYQSFLSSQLSGDTLMRAILGASAGNPEGTDYQTAIQRGYNPNDPMAKFLKSILYPNSSSGVGGNAEGAFAVGANYIPRDMTARIHKGEEITPRPYVDLQKAARDEANALMARLLSSNESLREEVINLRKTTEEGNKNTRKTADTLQGQQGVPFLVEIAQ